MDDRIAVSGRRQKLPLSVCGADVDQVSIYVPSLASAIQAYKSIGIGDWFLDHVEAVDILSDERFEVHLAFNYQILPAEFELIQIVKGSTIQFPCPGEISNSKNISGLSHFGFHVEDIQKAVDEFTKSGYKLMSWVQTVSHTGTDKKYEYVFLDTRVEFGFVSKLIARRS